jgi:hypothetical protein
MTLSRRVYCLIYKKIIKYYGDKHFHSSRFVSSLCSCIVFIFIFCAPSSPGSETELTISFSCLCRRYWHPCKWLYWKRLAEIGSKEKGKHIENWPRKNLHVWLRADWKVKGLGRWSCRYFTVLYRTVPYRTVPYRTVPYRTVQNCTVPYRTIPYHAIP